MIGKEHAWPVTITIVVAIAVVAMIGLVYPTWRDHYRPGWADGGDEVVAGLADDCVRYLQRQTGMQENNTEAQIRGACNCVSLQLYARMKTMSKAEMAEYTKRTAIKERMGTAVETCIERTGLSPAD